MDELLNELTGEVVDAAEHFATSRAIARELERLDRAIRDNKEEGKELKDAREQAVKELRAHVRDVGPLASSGRRPTRKTRKR